MITLSSPSGGELPTLVGANDPPGAVDGVPRMRVTAQLAAHLPPTPTDTTNHVQEVCGEEMVVRQFLLLVSPQQGEEHPHASEIQALNH